MSLPTSCPHLGRHLPDARDQVFCVLRNSKSWAHSRLTLSLLNQLTMFSVTLEIPFSPLCMWAWEVVLQKWVVLSHLETLAALDPWGQVYPNPSSLEKLFSEGFQTTTGTKMGEDGAGLFQAGGKWWERSVFDASDLLVPTGHFTKPAPSRAFGSVPCV